MDIKRLGNRSAALDTLKNKQNEKSRSAGDSASQAERAGVDTVSLSSQSKILGQAAKILQQDGAERSARVQQLKEQVANGTYNVDSKKVANSIVSYFRDDSSRAA